MAAPKGTRPPNAGKGRPPGVPNRVTKSAREAFQLAFDKLGGGEGLAKWAATHQTEFYKLYGRLIPIDLQVGDPDGKPLTIRLVGPDD